MNLESVWDLLKDKRALLWGTLILFILSLISIYSSWRATSKMLESFQDTMQAQEDSLDAISVPPTPPLYGQEDCAGIKKMINSFKITEMNKKMKEYTESERFKSLKHDMEERFVNLKCEEYLRKIAAGEIPAPQTLPDKNPALALEAAGVKTDLIEKAAATATEKVTA